MGYPFYHPEYIYHRPVDFDYVLMTGDLLGQGFTQVFNHKLKELKKYEMMNANSPEMGVVRNYIDWLLDIPWNVFSKEELDLNKARRTLDESHYGLDKVKTRIIELDREKNRIILSEKMVTQARDLEKRDQTLKKVKEGDELIGTVSGITPFGIFVNAQGLEGLVHLSELSWDKVEDIGGIFQRHA